MHLRILNPLHPFGDVLLFELYEVALILESAIWVRLLIVLGLEGNKTVFKKSIIQTTKRDIKCRFVWTYKTFRTYFLNVIYVRRGLTCTFGLTNDFIDGGQPSAKPHLHKAKPNRVIKTVFISLLATAYRVVVYPKSTRKTSSKINRP